MSLHRRCVRLIGLARRSVNFLGVTWLFGSGFGGCLRCIGPGSDPLEERFDFGIAFAVLHGLVHETLKHGLVAIYDHHLSLQTLKVPGRLHIAEKQPCRAERGQHEDEGEQNSWRTGLRHGVPTLVGGGLLSMLFSRPGLQTA